MTKEEALKFFNTHLEYSMREFVTYGHINKEASDKILFAVSDLAGETISKIT